MLKPQDTLLAIKYWSIRNSNARSNSDARLSVRELAQSIGVSASEVSKGTKRLLSARLLVERNQDFFAEQNALLEWLCYGVRYAYSPLQAGFGRGMATSWNCEQVQSDMLPPSPAFVWSSVEGRIEGVLVEPIHSSVPHAAMGDSGLYSVFALLDAIKLGKPRELAIARDVLNKLIKGNL